MGRSIRESNRRIPMGHASQPPIGLRALNHLPLTCLSNVLSVIRTSGNQTNNRKMRAPTQERSHSNAPKIVLSASNTLLTRFKHVLNTFLTHFHFFEFFAIFGEFGACKIFWAIFFN